MATGSYVNGIWVYGEDDSETTFSGLLNKLANSTATRVDNMDASDIVTGTLEIARGGTGATTATAALDNLNAGYVHLAGVHVNNFTSPQTLTTSWADITGTTITTTTTGRAGRLSVRIMFKNGASGAARAAGYRIALDNTPYGQEVNSIPVTYVTTSDVVSHVHVFPYTGLSSGSHTFKVQAVASANAAVQVPYVYLSVEELF